VLEIPRERTESIAYSRDVKQALEFRSGARIQRASFVTMARSHARSAAAFHCRPADAIQLHPLCEVWMRVAEKNKLAIGNHAVDVTQTR
jgi:hypothetical protein